ncbi:hypothetical protein K7432_000089 [Basidiobolus ranarum]|uniref:Uncharacterized protein n=1 Tax=Basidiobolus ranarum TaxID=34480 RepID=A0ABR2WBT1_9FUNG
MKYETDTHSNRGKMNEVTPLDWIVEHYCTRNSNDLPSFKLVKGLVEYCEESKHVENPSLPLLLFTIRDNLSENERDCNWENMLEIVKYIQQIERSRRKLREQLSTTTKKTKSNRLLSDSTCLEILFEQSISSLKRMLVLLEMNKLPLSSPNCMALINLLFPPNSRPFNRNQREIGNFPLKHIPNPRTQLHALLYQVDMLHLKSTGANKKRKASTCFTDSEVTTKTDLPEPARTLSKTDWTKIYHSLIDFLKQAENEIRILDEILNPATKGMHDNEIMSECTVLEKIVRHYMAKID